MDNIIDELVAVYQDDFGSNIVSRYIAGPIGSGKTHSVYSLPKSLMARSTEQSGFFVYLRSGYRNRDEDCQWKESPEILMSYYHPNSIDPKSRLSEWKTQQSVWQTLDLPDDEGLHGCQLRKSQNWTLLFQILQPRAYGKIVFIIDDFDQWTGTERKDWYVGDNKLAGSELQKTKLLILFTGELSLKRLRQISPQDAVPTDTRELLVGLPSDNIVANMIREMGLAAPDSLRSEVESLEHIKEIRDITGSYPILVDELMKQMANQTETISRWTQLLEDSVKSPSFQSSLVCLYKQLSEVQQQVLSLLVIAMENKRTAKEMRNVWEERSLTKVVNENVMLRELQELERRKLLLKSTQSTDSMETRDFSIASTALQEWVNKQVITDGLRVQTGMNMQSNRSRKQLTFLSWFAAGIVWYVLMIILRPILPTKLPEEFLPGVYFVGFIPAIGYFILQLKSVRPTR